MTDTTKTRSNGRARGGAGLPARDDLFDEVWGMVQSMVAEALTAALPTTGTVVGRDGGGVRVNMDEEGVDRQVGFPRAKGVAYNPGDRVVVHQVKGGERVILGRVDSDSNERAVDAPQIEDNAIGTRAIQQGGVDTGNIKDRSVTGGKLDSSLENKITGAAQKSDLDDYAKKSALDDYAKQSSLSGFAKDSRVDDLERRIKRLEDKKNK